jgi:hypothetical protein
MTAPFRTIVEEAAAEFARADPERAGHRPAPGKWSAKEIIGHLIDSAANNHLRFVNGPARDDLVFQGYDQESWVATQRYDAAEWSALVELWRSYNLHLAHVMDAIPQSVKDDSRGRHNFDRLAFHPVSTSEPSTLGYLMDDYVAHLKHHLVQVRALLA